MIWQVYAEAQESAFWEVNKISIWCYVNGGVWSAGMVNPLWSRGFLPPIFHLCHEPSPFLLLWRAGLVPGKLYPTIPWGLTEPLIVMHRLGVMCTWSLGKHILRGHSFFSPRLNFVSLQDDPSRSKSDEFGHHTLQKQNDANTENKRLSESGIVSVSATPLLLTGA